MIFSKILICTNVLMLFFKFQHITCCEFLLYLGKSLQSIVLDSNVVGAVLFLDYLTLTVEGTTLLRTVGKYREG